MDNAKLIKILNPQSGTLEETTLAPKRFDNQDIMEVFETGIGKKRGRRWSLLEIEEAVGTSEFPTLLRDGLKPILFSAYNMVPPSYQDWVYTVASDRPEENYLEGSTLGYPPIVAEGDAFPEADMALDRTVRVVNQKRGMILTITREMVNFDRVGMIQQIITDAGRALATGHEQACYDVLSTTGNYVRNSTTGDNDIGANTGSTTFSALGLVTAYQTLTTMKHRRSGRYLGIRPDTLILSPSLEFAAKQLLLGDSMWRTGGSTTPDVYGTGINNPFSGVVRNLIVSPFMVAGNWVLCEAKKFIANQVVWGPEMFSATNAPESVAFLERDSYRYRVSEMYGVGMVNDRFAYLSSATAAPVVG